jgi:hypothetical protein
MNRSTFALLSTLITVVSSASAQEPDWQQVDTILGRKPAVSQDVRRYGFPRTDLDVTLDGVKISAGFALGGWLAFKPAHGTAMVMGDLVLLQTEVSPVVTTLVENGLEVTAIHNHVLRASPLTFYMHVSGHGDPVKLATTLKAALVTTGTPMQLAAASSPQQPPELDLAQLDAAIGVKGRANGSVYQFSVPRRQPVTEHGVVLSPAGPLGVATAINFQPTGGGKAATTGDFVLTATEVPAVVKALRGNDIEVTAMHSHMLAEEPRLTFLHFWANADAVKLAQGLRAALDHADHER